MQKSMSASEHYIVKDGCMLFQLNDPHWHTGGKNDKPINHTARADQQTTHTVSSYPLFVGFIVKIWPKSSGS